MSALRRWLRKWGELLGATAGLAAVAMALWAVAVTAPIVIHAPGGPPLLPVIGPLAPGGPPPLPGPLPVSEPRVHGNVAQVTPQLAHLIAHSPPPKRHG